MNLLSLRKTVRRYLPGPVLETFRRVMELSATPTQKKVGRLMRQNYDHLKLEAFTEKGISETRVAAEKLYSNRWNYYSNALRREVVYGFQSCIVQLQPVFDKIDYLEIGSAQGLSMSLVGGILRETGLLRQLVSVDPYFKGGYEEGEGGPWSNVQRVVIDKQTRDQAKNLYKALGLDVNMLEMKSSEGLKQLLVEGRKFHLIYIDGSHEGLNPMIDFGLSYELLHSNGIIMLDDHYWTDVADLKSLCDRHCEKIDESWKIAAYRISK